MNWANKPGHHMVQIWVQILGCRVSLWILAFGAWGMQAIPLWKTSVSRAGLSATQSRSHLASRKIQVLVVWFPKFCWSIPSNSIFIPMRMLLEYRSYHLWLAKCAEPVGDPEPIFQADATGERAWGINKFHETPVFSVCDLKIRGSCRRYADGCRLVGPPSVTTSMGEKHWTTGKSDDNKAGAGVSDTTQIRLCCDRVSISRSRS